MGKRLKDLLELEDDEI